MRLLLLVLNIVVCMSLSITACEAVAGEGKGQKQYQTYVKKKASNNPDDVWERVRLGMKIPWPSPKPILSKQSQNRENSRFNNKYSSYSTHTENVRPEQQPTAPKYIIQPHTAVAPLHNYTALGYRLRFGADAPPVTDGNCVPPVSTQVRQESPKSKNNSAVNVDSTRSRDFHAQQHKRSVSGTLKTEPEMPSLSAQATNNSTPCIGTDERLAAASKQGKQRDATEQSSPKKTMINDRINKYVALFSQNPGYLYQVAERARPYLYHIVEMLSNNQLPLELALLPIVESGYQPTALSPKGAAGLWQFIPSTGKDYNLKQNNRYDERLDILASTQAAIRFLSDLKAHFNGDWLLALAAYNCGQGAVDNAISRNLAEGLDTDYWSLRLPEETQEYVPRLLALSGIFADPENYGLKFTPIKNEPYFVKVKIDRDIDIKYLADKKFAVLARLVNLSHEQFKHLNPGYLKPTLSTEGSYTFLLPHANASQLLRLLTSIAQFMAEPVSQTMKGALKANSPTIIDLNEPRLSVRL